MKRPLLAPLLALALLADSRRSAAAEPPPLAFASVPDKVALTDAGTTRTWYRVSPGKPLRLTAGQPLTLVVTGRPVVADADPTLIVTVGDGPPISQLLPSAGAMLVPGPGFSVGPMRAIKVPVAAAKSVVSISVNRGAALVVFGLQAASTTALPAATPAALVAATPAALAAATPTPDPVATPIAIAAATPAATPSSLDAVAAATPLPPLITPTIPFIPKQIERLGLVPKIGGLVPLGAVDGPGGFNNLYLGAELRYSLRAWGRRLAIGAEVGTYRVRNTEQIVATTPFHGSVDDDVEFGYRVTPVLATAVYRFASSKRAGFYAGAGAGIAAVSRQESLRLRAPESTSRTTPAAQVRLGAERRAGVGWLAFEASYLHVVNDPDVEPYLSGPLVGLQYRFAFF